MFYGAKRLFIVNVSNARKSFEFITFFYQLINYLKMINGWVNFFWNQPAVLVFIQNICLCIGTVKLNKSTRSELIVEFIQGHSNLIQRILSPPPSLSKRIWRLSFLSLSLSPPLPPSSPPPPSLSLALSEDYFSTALELTGEKKNSKNGGNEPFEYELF